MNNPISLSSARTEDNLNRSLHRCGHYLYHHATGPRQRAVIQLLQQNGPMHQQEIQESLNIQPGSASELISKLESKGFIRRQRYAADKRRITIMLTPQGHALETATPEQALTRRYAALTRDEQILLTSLLDKLLSSWNTEEVQG